MRQLRHLLSAIIVFFCIISFTFAQAGTGTENKSSTGSTTSTGTTTGTTSSEAASALTTNTTGTAAADTQTAAASTVPGPVKSTGGFFKANGTENWDYLYDISGLKPGLYNLLVRGIDKAGNVQEAGPYNILIDPESDKPIVQISNPSPFQRSGSNLNVVGTAIDDDSVKRVEVRLDSGEWKAARGTNYWSYLLDVSLLEDGLHTLEARSFDVKDLEGKSVSVKFHLDTKKPRISVTSPVSGSLVSGSTSFKGTVIDENSIDNLFYSLDTGKTWKQLYFQGNKDATEASFDLRIETKSLKDGSAVIYFKSTDKVGSTGYSAFMAMVDNTAPEVSITTPILNSKVNGSFAVSGKTFDLVGIKSLSYKALSESGEIALIPGNPYFFKRFDVKGAKENRIEIAFTATDLAGNVSVVKRSFDIDSKADLPVVTLLSPEKDSKEQGSVFVSGLVKDDDGVAKIRYKLDSNEYADSEANDSFVFSLKDLSAGKHNLLVKAVDLSGIEGEAASVSFSIIGKAPTVSLDTALSSLGTVPFYPGIEVPAIDGKAKISATIKGENSVSFVEYALGNTAYTSTTKDKSKLGNTVALSIPLAKTNPYGINELKIRATDEFNQVSEFKTFIYVTNFSKVREAQGLVFVDSRIEESGLVKLSKTRPFSGFLNGEELLTVEIVPKTDIVQISKEGNAITVLPNKDGVSAKVKIRATTAKRHTYESQEFVFSTDTKAPDLTITAPASDVWVQSSVILSGSALDAGGLASLEYSIGSGEFKAISADAKTGAFKQSITLDGEDGSVLLNIKSKDLSGNETVKVVALSKDTTKADAELLFPEPLSSVFGQTSFLIKITERTEALLSVDVSLDGKSFTSVSPASTIRFDGNIKKDSKLIVRIKDRAGNTIDKDLSSNLGIAPDLESKTLLASDVLRVNSKDATDLPYISLSIKDSLEGEAKYSLSALETQDPELLSPETKKGIRVSGLLSLDATFLNTSFNDKAKTIEILDSMDAALKPVTVSQSKVDQPFKAVFKLDTTKLANQNGLNTVWIKYADKTLGADRFFGLVLDVDNTKPVLQLVKSVPLQGGLDFLIGLKASDERGLRKLTVKIDANEQEIAISPFKGNFVIPITFAADSKKPEALITAVDESGNKNTLLYKLTPDTVSDIPLLTLISAAVTEPIQTALNTVFSVKDDDGLSVLSYSIDKAAAVNAPLVSDVFALRLENLAPGLHEVSLSAKDKNGLVSKSLVIPFTVKGNGAVISSSGILKDKETVPYTEGGLVVLEKDTSFKGQVNSPDKIVEAEYSVNGGKIEKLVFTKSTDPLIQDFSVPLPVTLPYERVTVKVRVKDIYATETINNFVFYKVAPVIDTSLDTEGLYFADARISEDNSVVLVSGDTIVTLANTQELKSVEIVPANKQVEVSLENKKIVISAKEEGISPSFVVRAVTKQGDTFDSKNLIFKIDSSNPELVIKTPVIGSYVKNTVALAGEARDSNGIALIEASIDAGLTWQNVAFKASSSTSAGTTSTVAGTTTAAGTKAGTSAATTTSAKTSADTKDVSFSVNLNLEVADGSPSILVRVRDTTGKETKTLLSVNKDTVAPRYAFVTPILNNTVNGTISIASTIQDESRLESVEYSYNGKEFVKADLNTLGWTEAPVMKDGKVVPKAFIYESAAIFEFDFSKIPNKEKAFTLKLKDKSGNETLSTPLALETPPFIVDSVADKPLAYVQVPLSTEIIQSDFVISGVALDDDKVKTIVYRIDSGEWKTLEDVSSFAIPIALKDTVDNEHLFEVYATDVNGVKGETVKHSYKISKAEPEAALVSPKVEITNKGIIELSGTAKDANGIKEVFVSFDNGHTFERATGTTDWKYRLDTKILSDGVYNIQTKILDNYGVQGFYTALISIDNTAPVIVVDYPLDGATFTDNFSIEGRSSDTMMIKDLTLEITRLYDAKIDKSLTYELAKGGFYTKTIDLSSLTPGNYNIRVIAKDAADNISYIARNIIILESAVAERVELQFPSTGEEVSGSFTIDGKVFSKTKIATVVVYANKEAIGTAKVNPDGYFTFNANAELLKDGAVEITASITGKGGALVKSQSTNIQYSKYGPSIDFTNFKNGDYVIKRPYIKGTVSWNLLVPDRAEKEAYNAYEQARYGKRVVSVEISRDNGRSFERAQGAETWQFRFETQTYANGPLFILVKAKFADGTFVIRKINLNVDLSKPLITILKPGEGGIYNELISINGTARDENGIQDVSLIIRQGDKASYKMPSFIQGSYLDVHFLGATRWEGSLGLTFFDDNVKLQAGIGQGFEVEPTWNDMFGFDTSKMQSRFHGFTANAKMLANLGYIPFAAFFGPDWDFFSMSFTMGANFTYFSQSSDIAKLFSPEIDPITNQSKLFILSSVLGQWEFAKITFADAVFFKSISTYLEGQLVFIPSEAKPAIIPVFGLGTRIGLF